MSEESSSWWKGALRNVKSQMSARAVLKNVLVVIAAILVVTVIGLILVVLLHRRMYKYWRNKPVSWMTLFPAPKGVIDTKATVNEYRPLPRGFELEALPVRAAASAEVARFLDEHAGAPFTITPRRAIAMLGADSGAQQQTQVLALYAPPEASPPVSPPVSPPPARSTGGRRRLVGLVSTTRTKMDTPLHAAVPCQHIDNLVVAKDLRGRALCTHLIDGAIRACKDKPPIGLFMSERQMPWAEAASVVRSAAVINTTLLTEGVGQSRVREVRDLKHLPSRALESSAIRVENGQTLEPTPDRAFWHDRIRSPYDIVLAINEEDWILLHRLPPHTRRHTQPTAEGVSIATDAPARAAEDDAPALVLRGFSVSPERVATYLVAYLRDARPAHDAVLLIVPSTLETHLQPLFGAAMLTPWEMYDHQYMYFYNYRLDKLRVHMPYTCYIAT